MDNEEKPKHIINETRTTDVEKVVAAFQPMLEPTVRAWKEADIAAVSMAESGATKRTGFMAAALAFVVACVTGIAVVCVFTGQAAIAEKIVIGLLAFVGGYSANRSR